MINNILSVLTGTEGSVSPCVIEFYILCFYNFNNISTQIYHFKHNTGIPTEIYHFEHNFKSMSHDLNITTKIYQFKYVLKPTISCPEPRILTSPSIFPSSDPVSPTVRPHLTHLHTHPEIYIFYSDTSSSQNIYKFHSNSSKISKECTIHSCTFDNIASSECQTNNTHDTSIVDPHDFAALSWRNISP